MQDADKAERQFVTHRELKSDLLLVWSAGVDAYVQFRDVFDVDGFPVRDRSERLLKLFLTPSASTTKQAAQIMAESARYNIGIERNINVPLIGLVVLRPAFQPRFRYTVGAERKGAPRGMPKSPRFSLAADAWVIGFEETASPTVIKGDNRDAKARGRVWIEPETSRVLMTELIVEARTVRTTVRVSYESKPLVKFLLPAELRETYVLSRGLRFYTFEGTATYRNFRQFTVTTHEQIGPIQGAP